MSAQACSDSAIPPYLAEMIKLMTLFAPFHHPRSVTSYALPIASSQVTFLHECLYHTRDQSTGNLLRNHCIQQRFRTRPWLHVVPSNSIARRQDGVPSVPIILHSMPYVWKPTFQHADLFEIYKDLRFVIPTLLNHCEDGVYLSLPAYTPFGSFIRYEAKGGTELKTRILSSHLTSICHDGRFQCIGSESSPTGTVERSSHINCIEPYELQRCPPTGLWEGSYLRIYFCLTMVDSLS
ncbi:hypothetical protein K503DRAFT_765535 [Rhizopogon vinicolor AM-OR11-026]|uniref:Uncharacterized protein n=1 Tax=Rhizopogon vinicolor AM-OR11-026 TaxID=1314800 RepID=A0A1B7NG19_9AGAM|nr:hypothetical protein K503DRAFT_765535 [Rhizopogon vinicolor AM-OR11-026]